MLYSLCKPFFFLLPPETAHTVALNILKWSAPFLPTTTNIKKPITLMGLTFPNRVGLAAGLDKNADYVEGLAKLGFGFLEIGTVTPAPQPGNPRPRLFRLQKDKAIINRMGFNSKGAKYVANKLATSSYRSVLGINIGKNKETTLENAVADYVFCFRTLAPFASYITINISSPNTEKLRDLQEAEKLRELLKILKQEQQVFLEKEKKYVPLVVKISPDIAVAQLKGIAAIFIEQQIDGVIATNTTITREGLRTKKYMNEIGGLSGKPLAAKSTALIRHLRLLLPDSIPIIAAGGIMNAHDAEEKIAAGAALVQIYSGLIYSGPLLIKKLF